MGNVSCETTGGRISTYLCIVKINDYAFKKSFHLPGIEYGMDSHLRRMHREPKNNSNLDEGVGIQDSRPVAYFTIGKAVRGKDIGVGYITVASIIISLPRRIKRLSKNPAGLTAQYGDGAPMPWGTTI